MAVGPIPPEFGGRASGGIAMYLINLFSNFPRSAVKSCLFVANSDMSLIDKDKLQMFEEVYSYQTRKIKLHKLLILNFLAAVKLAVRLRMNFFKLLFLPIDYHEAISQCKPDVIFVMQIEYYALYTWLANKFGIPVAATIHSFNSVNTNDSRSNEKLARIIRFNARHVNSLISVSQSVLEEAQKNFAIIKNNNLIANGVDVDEFQPERKEAACRRLNISSEKINMLFTGNLNVRKSVNVLIQAVAKLSRQQHLLVLIVGDGEERHRLQTMATDLNLSDVIKFMGGKRYDEMRDWYNACDIFVLPSKAEGLSLSLLEAMSCARPVITTRPQFGSYDAIIDGETGFLFEYGDVKQLTQKLKMLIENQKLRKQIGENARRHISSQFTSQIMAEKTLQVLRKSARMVKV